MASAPDELMLMLYLGHAESGEAAATITVCYAGDAEAGVEAVRPLREQLPVLHDGLGLTSYLQIQVMQGDTPFGLRHYWKGHFVDALPDDLIDQIVEHYQAHPDDGHDELLIEPMHGAALRVAPEATAFSRREPCFNVSAPGNLGGRRHRCRAHRVGATDGVRAAVVLLERRRLSQLQRRR